MTAAGPHTQLATLAAGLRSGSIDPVERAELAEQLERIAAGEDAAAALGKVVKERLARSP